MINRSLSPENGALVGAWDFVSAEEPKAMMENLIGNYRIGKYVEGIVRKTVKDYTQSKNTLSEAINLKYTNFLSRRKFNVLCKTQSSVFDPNKNVWVPRNVKCMDIDIQLSQSCFPIYPMKVLRNSSKPYILVVFVKFLMYPMSLGQLQASYL